MKCGVDGGLGVDVGGEGVDGVDTTSNIRVGS